MKRDAVVFWGAIVLLAGLSSGLGWWLARQTMMPPQQPLPTGFTVVEPGQALPPLALPDLDTGELRKLDGPGRPRLVNYWASWCGPCRKEMPVLNTYALEQGGNGVQVIGIALDSPAEALAFRREVPVSFALLVETPGPGDSSVRLGNRRGILPYTVLIDSNGKLARTHYGPFATTADIRAFVRD